MLIISSRKFGKYRNYFLKDEIIIILEEVITIKILSYFLLLLTTESIS